MINNGIVNVYKIIFNKKDNLSIYFYSMIDINDPLRYHYYLLMNNNDTDKKPVSVEVNNAIQILGNDNVSFQLIDPNSDIYNDFFHQFSLVKEENIKEKIKMIN